ncbi:MAG TPA: YeeE/YedE family protein [Methylocella sp.]|nr:YeeE/YedE family protein [Methylocella sp.]
MTKDRSQNFAALAAGVLFGFGLSLSGMLDPARVRGFLDIFGRFDPSLAFVLAGAVLMSHIGYVVSRRLRHPLFEETYHLPKKRKIDWPLLTGAAIFGAGWGIGGICPGPALAGLALGILPFYVFTGAMVTGVLLHDHWPKHLLPTLKRKPTSEGSAAESLSR